jgi:hypothetical protein
VPLLELRVGRSNLVERVGRSDWNGDHARGDKVSHRSQYLGGRCRSASFCLDPTLLRELECDGGVDPAPFDAEPDPFAAE